MSLLLYKSSAGSGKTFVLVKHYLLLCFNEKSNDYFKHILAVTFTIKATFEMKERILNTLKKIVSSHYDDLGNALYEEVLENKNNEINNKTDFEKKAKAIIENILHKYDSFSISTIDSFFNSLVRAFAFDLKIPMNYEITMDNKAIMNMAIERMLQQLGKDAALTKFILNYVNQKLEDNENIDFKTNLLKLERILFHEKRIEHNTDKELDLDWYSKLNTKLRTENKEFEQKLKQIATRFFEVMNRCDMEFEWFLRKTIPNYYLRFVNDDYKEIEIKNAIIDALDNDKWTKKDNKNKEIENAFINAKADLTYILKETKELVDNQLIDYNKNQTYIKQHLTFALLVKLNNEIINYKTENSVLTFDEITKNIAEVIMQQHIPFIYERLDAKYFHYFIDEFQDTSTMQFFNFIPLLTNHIDTKENLLVGDAKQSIYRFRNGEVEIIKNLPYLTDELKTKTDIYQQRKIIEEIQIKELTNNYRSCENIIDFNNEFFKHLCESSSVYVNEIYSDYYQTKIKKTAGYVQLERLPKSINNELESDWVINKIKKVIEDGFEYKDICILIGKNKFTSMLTPLFIEHQIPFVSVASLELQSSLQVQIVISYLYHIIYQNEKIYPHQLEYYLKNKLENENRATEHSAELMQLNCTQPNFEAIKLLSCDNAVIEICKMFNININDIFITTLIEKIANNKKISTLYSCLKWWEDKGLSTKIQSPSGNNAVEMMTYHRAKGLQFPVVICPFIKDERPVSESVIMDYNWDENITQMLYDITENNYENFEDEFYIVNQQNKQLDNFNASYVAFTRAEKRLYIQFTSTTKDKSKKNNEKNIDFEIDKLTQLKVQSNELLNVYLDAKDCGDMFEIGEEELEQKKEIIQNEYAITPPQTQSMWVFDGDNFKNEYINDENYLGSLLHDLLMHVYTSNDITKLIEKIKTEPKYTKLTQKWIIKNLNAIQNNEALKPYFDETKTVKNEIEIAYQAGELIRIDKLISDENQCVILDYKTGIERKEHHAQMVFYKNILHQLNYKNVKAVLYYTNDNKIVTL